MAKACIVSIVFVDKTRTFIQWTTATYNHDANGNSAVSVILHRDFEKHMTYRF
jgi:hypothetical protein